MNFLISFYNIVLYQPLFNILVVLYLFLPGHDLGLAVIGLTLLIKLLLYPSSKKSFQYQMRMAELAPKIKELQTKYKDNKVEQSKATFDLYKQEKVSPASGCLPLILQLPILIALYQVFSRGLKTENLQQFLYHFVPFFGPIQTISLGMFDLARPFFVTVGGQAQYYWPALVLALVAGFLQWLQMKSAMPPMGSGKPAGDNKVAIKEQKPGGDFGANMQKQMAYMFPAFTVLIVLQFGSVIGVYFLASSVFSILEQKYIKSKLKIS